MTYRPDFSGCWDKIDRAWVHRNSLNAEIGPLFLGEANQVRIVGKFDSESSYHVFRTVAIPDFPLRYFGILIGDAPVTIPSVLGRPPRGGLAKLGFPYRSTPQARISSRKSLRTEVPSRT